MPETLSTFQSSLLFFALSLIPSNILRYIALGFTLISLLAYSVYHNPPSARLARLCDTITMVNDILTHAKAKCRHNHLLLAENETRLLRTKLSASQIHSKLLETDIMSWKLYFQSRLSISRSLTMCECELRAIQISCLLLIEAARQHKLTADINGA
ncbi:hypothetical protein K438DRAFT_2014346 [Mycena galopus ATCC 62051]|nr:hypothetical protein K438DRAFT_2014346 [Mycena galopus ATCC 62051]